jgi:hypothetical protein
MEKLVRDILEELGENYQMVSLSLWQGPVLDLSQTIAAKQLCALIQEGPQNGPGSTISVRE